MLLASDPTLGSVGHDSLGHEGVAIGLDAVWIELAL